MTSSTPKSLFEQRVRSVLSAEEGHKDILESVFKLQQLLMLERSSSTGDPESSKIQAQLLTKVGMQQYLQILSFLWGRTISFPTQEEFQDSLIITLCYYYKDVENKDWNSIKELLNMPNLNTIKYGIRVRQLEQFIQQQLVNLTF